MLIVAKRALVKLSCCSASIGSACYRLVVSQQWVVKCCNAATNAGAQRDPLAGDKTGMIDRLVSSINLLGARRLVAMIFACFCLSSAALAADFQVNAGALLRYDDNVFRLNSAVAESLPHEGREIITVLSAKASGSAPVGIMKVQLGADIQKNVFAYHSNLDSLEYGLSSELSYPGASGDASLSAERRRRASSFDDLSIGANNIQTLTTFKGTGTRAILGNLRLSATVSYLRNTNSDDLVKLNDNYRTAFAAGAGYYADRENLVVLEFSTEHGKGLRQKAIFIGQTPVSYASDFTENMIDIRYLWNPSVIWSLSGKVGYAKHNDRSVLASDFSGIVGSTAITWSPLESLRFKVSAARSFSSDDSLFSNGIKVTTFGANLVYQPSPMFEARLSAQTRNRVFRYDLEAVNVLAPRDEDLRTVGAVITYTTASKIALVAGVQHSNRNASLNSDDYSSNQAYFGVGFAFGR